MLFRSHQVRIVPYKFDVANPFIELYFHYNINNKTYLSPQSFGSPDPIVEFANKLKNMGDKEDWKTGKSMEPKLRTFVPVIVRGKEDAGVQFWGFGKTVYQEILGYIADPDYGDITDPTTGRDLTIEYKSAEQAGTQYPTTTIRVKPNVSPLVQDPQEAQKFLDTQTAITDLYPLLSYEELSQVLEGWLNPTDEANAGTAKVTAPPATQPVVQQPVVTQPPVQQPAAQPAAQPAVHPPKPSKPSKEGMDAFDELFNA